jgi:hypothetical protein
MTTMTTESTTALLAYLVEAFPTMPLGEHAVEVWADSLGNVEVADCRNAAHRIAREDTFPPSIARVRAVASDFARRRESEYQLPAARSDSVKGKRLLAAIQAYAAAVERPAHDHHRGVEHCPCCSTSAERLRQWDADMRVLLHEAGVA